MLRHSYVKWSVLVWGAMLAAPVAGQSEVTIRGVVKDTAGTILSGAEVVVGVAVRPVVTGSDGSFRLQVEPGREWLYVRKLGYAPARHALTLRAGTSRRLEVVLEPLPERLPDIEVEAESGFEVQRLADFWNRSYVSWGRFFTRDDIEEFGRPYLRYLVQQELPLAALSQWGDRNPRSSFEPVMRLASSRMGTTCVPALSLDGEPPIGLWYVDDFTPDQVEALEVYRPTLARIPPEYAFYRNAMNCGLVILWLR